MEKLGVRNGECFDTAVSTIFWHAPKYGKNAPTQKERWLGQTGIFSQLANFDSKLLLTSETLFYSVKI